MSYFTALIVTTLRFALLVSVLAGVSHLLFELGKADCAEQRLTPEFCAVYVE